MTPLYLAGEQIDTPDPKRICFFGQQIRIKWNLPTLAPAELLIHIRYGTREIRTFTVPIHEKLGWWTYRLANDEYASLCGIISFKVALFQNGQLIEEWRHHLWTDIIEINEG